MKTALACLAVLSFSGAALAQDADTNTPAITMELVDLPIEQQAALRCGVARL